MIVCRNDSLLRRLHTAQRVWWFLDYDGTLADFAPNPDVILPDPDLIRLITQLANREDMRVTIISGRRLTHIEQLLPIEGIIKAGSYGLEIRLEGGELLHPVAFGEIRPFLNTLKIQWEQLLANRTGFYLEDKGWTLAIHAKDADPDEGNLVIEQAKQLADYVVTREVRDVLQILDGHCFLEVAPQSANKRLTVAKLIEEHHWPGSLPVYLGDDDKDAQAFSVIQARGGIAIAVGNRSAVAAADCHLDSPADSKKWLGSFLQ